MKVKSALKKMCEYCYIQRKGKKIYVRCKADPRHKQRQGRKFSTCVEQGISNQAIIKVPEFPEYHIDLMEFIKKLPYL